MPSLVKIVLLGSAVGILWTIQATFRPTEFSPEKPFLELGVGTPEFLKDQTKTQHDRVKATAKININQATIQELESLPGIGPKLAKAIIRFRDEQGDFEVLEQLKEVRGIGEKRFSAISGFLTIEEEKEGSPPGIDNP